MATVSHSHTLTDEPWHANVFVENVSINFQLDPGADVTIITDSTYKNINKFSENYVPQTVTLKILPVIQ